MQEDRRRYYRIDAELLLGAKPLDGEVFLSSKTKDVSEAGLKIVLKEPLGKGKVLHIKLIYPHTGEIIEVLARVMWSKKNEQESYNLGIESINCATYFPAIIKKFKKNIK